MSNLEIIDSNAIPPQAFTKKHSGKARVITTPIAIYSYEDEIDISKFIQFNAIWDTGATSTCITSNVVKTLGLKPFGKRDVVGIGKKQEDANMYFVNAILRNNLIVTSLEVVEVENISGADVLIGMNLITIGDFTITNYNNKTVFSFQTPSQGVIDFEKDAKTMDGKSVLAGDKIGRNDPCPCGSGKKYKKCHGK